MSDDWPTKRRPLLIDRFMAQKDHPTVYPRRLLDQVKRSMRSARRFVFDEEAARRVARVVMDVPDLLLREHAFARAPYDITWIELPSWAFWMELRERDPVRYDAQGEWGRPETADHTVGFLIDHNRVNTVAGGTVANPDERALISPLQYRINTEWPFEDQVRFAEMAGASRLGLSAFMWGSTFEDVPREQWHALRDHTVIEHPFLDPKVVEKVIKGGGLAASLRGAVGDVRTIIALLLMMNRPAITRYAEDIPHARGFIHGKLRPYMAHTTVKVSLDAVETLRLIGTPRGESVGLRRHEVRGHYCHDKTARDFADIAGCIHEFRATYDDWTPVGDNFPVADVRHWVCACCEGKRWWRDAHERGTCEVGFVARDGYEVGA